MPSLTMETSAALWAPMAPPPSGSWKSWPGLTSISPLSPNALEREGVESFRESYRQVLSSIEESAARLQGGIVDYARP